MYIILIIFRFKFIFFSFILLFSDILWRSFIKALFIGKDDKDEIFGYSVKSSGHFNIEGELIELEIQFEHIV